MTSDRRTGNGVRSGGSTSHDLLVNARRGAPAAWERLVRLYAPLVASWCRRWEVAEQDVGDVLQDVFSAVAGHLEQFRKERPADTFRGWLRTIARNKVLDHFRRRSAEPAADGGTEATRRMRQIPDTGSADEQPHLADDAWSDSALMDNLLHQALETIRSEFHERTWKAFWGVVVDGRLTSDVAADLEMTSGAVRVAKSRILLRLRRELGDAPDGA
jgi:RNA polymerase sigma-70 factor (ECF subfamily)